MGWRERFDSQGSFRFVPFFVRSSDFSSGTRVGVHEFANRDLPYHEHLGRRQRVYRVEAVVLGDDYLEQRDRLIAALERGPAGNERVGGLLVHPHFGRLTAVCSSFSVRESANEGGAAFFDLEFLETYRDGALTQSTRTRGAGEADSIGAQAGDAIAAEVEEDLLATGVPESVREGAAGALRKLGGILEPLRVFENDRQEVAAFQRDVQDLIGRASTLATLPAELVSTTRGVIDGILGAAANARLALFAYETMFGFEPDLEAGSSQTAAQADANAGRVQRLTRQLAVSGAVRAAARVSWSFRDEAFDTRDRILAEIDALEETSLDDSIDALEELRRVLVETVPPAEEELPELRTITLPRAEPALVLAYRLFANPELDAEIAVRNRVQHPGFVPAGVELEVLSRG